MHLCTTCLTCMKKREDPLFWTLALCDEYLLIALIQISNYWFSCPSYFIHTVNEERSSIGLHYYRCLLDCSIKSRSKLLSASALCHIHTFNRQNFYIELITEVPHRKEDFTSNTTSDKSNLQYPSSWHNGNPFTEYGAGTFCVFCDDLQRYFGYWARCPWSHKVRHCNDHANLLRYVMHNIVKVDKGR